MLNKTKVKKTYFVAAPLAAFLLAGALFTGVCSADTKAQAVNGTADAAVTAAATTAETDITVQNGSAVKNVCFKGMATSFSCRAFTSTNDGSTNHWNTSFNWLNGEVGCKTTIADSYPQNLTFSSAVGSGKMKIQIEQGDKVVEVPLGEQTVSLGDFSDGTIIIRVIADNANNGHVNVAVK